MAWTMKKETLLAAVNLEAVNVTDKIDKVTVENPTVAPKSRNMDLSTRLKGYIPWVPETFLARFPVSVKSL